MEKHQKHAKLAKPNIGNFGRNEWAILGTPCGIIQKLAKALSENIPTDYKTAYIDADHKAGDAAESLSYFLDYTDKINYNRFDFQQKMTPFHYKNLFNETDIVLINGNHFEGKRQLVVLDEKKFDSLSRKLNRLTQIDAFLNPNMEHPVAIGTEGVVIPDFLKNHVKNWAEIPVFNLNEVEKIVPFLLSKIEMPKLNALILAGGKSTRMGHDKALIEYHGKAQWQFLSEILRGVGLGVFISCRAEQAILFEGENLIFDSFTGLGPFGAIASAFRENPNAAWLVVACDLPLLDEHTLKFLIDNRNPSKIATTYRSPESADGFPEPLITIWEPKSYPILLQFLTQGVSCPRKVLINSDVALLNPVIPETLMNVNTPEDFEKIQEMLLSKI